MTVYSIVDDNPVPYFFRIVFLSNNYRDPLLRKIETRYKLTRPEFSILVCLGIKDGISAIDICDITRQPQNTVSRGVFLLSEKAHIKKVTEERDNRIKRLYLTAKGRTAHNQLMEYLVEADRNMVECLSAKEKEQLDRILAKMCSAIPPTSS